MTLADKLLLGHLDAPNTADLVPGKSYLALRPDRVVFQDVLGQTAMLQFMQTGRDRVALPTTIHCDHLIQARKDGLHDLRASVSENGEVYDFLRAAAASTAPDSGNPAPGIIHQVVLENYAFPGQLVLGTDSHTPNAGGLGACAVGVGGADAVEAMAGLPWELLYPRHLAVVLTGALGVDGPEGRHSLRGRAARSRRRDERDPRVHRPRRRHAEHDGKATIANMGAELGATTSVFPADDGMLRYLRATGRGNLTPSSSRATDPGSSRTRRSSRIPSAITKGSSSSICPGSSRMSQAPILPIASAPSPPSPTRCAIRRVGSSTRCPSRSSGSCTNSSYEDMTRAADVAAQAGAHGIRASAALLVTPGSERIRATIERDGQMKKLAEAGAVVLASACGPCIGQWRRGGDGAAAPSTIVTSFNRNFAGRNDGRRSTMAFIASPEIVMALAVAGRLSFNPLTDSLVGADGERFRLEPPAPAPDVPVEPFAAGNSRYSAPSESAGAPLHVDPKSLRLQVLEPWPAWSGGDFVDLPILVKTRGKTTTDQISPAGEWLNLRGHLEKFSDNLLMGAVNAFTGEVGTASNAFTGETGPISALARDYRARGVEWAIVGDHNYGKGAVASTPPSRRGS